MPSNCEYQNIKEDKPECIDDMLIDLVVEIKKLKKLASVIEIELCDQVDEYKDITAVGYQLISHNVLISLMYDKAKEAERLMEKIIDSRF